VTFTPRFDLLYRPLLIILQRRQSHQGPFRVSAMHGLNRGERSGGGVRSRGCIGASESFNLRRQASWLRVWRGAGANSARRNEHTLEKEQGIKLSSVTINNAPKDPAKSWNLFF